MDDIPKDQAIALFDLDGTLTEPGSELLIETFLRDSVIGSTRVREELTNRFAVWNKARREGSPNYEGYLKDVGDLWAKMLYKDDTGRRIQRPQVIKDTEIWFRETGVRDIQPYADEVLDTVRSFKFKPVLVTGAPFELAVHYANALNIDHVFAMDAEIDADMRYTTKMRFPANTGIGANKAEVCDRLVKALHTIGFAMGDTKSDFVLFDHAMNLKFPHDMQGGAVLINPRTEVVNAAKSGALGHFNSSGDLEILEQSDKKGKILKRVRDLVRHRLGESDMENGADLKKAA